MRRWLLSLLFLLTGVLHADETVRICYGYGCLVQADIRYTEGQLGEVRRMLFATVNPENERKMISAAIGRLYAWAGEQSDIHNDRAGNYDDGHVSGKMDCIDHSTSTTRLLKLLEARGYLRWHRVLEPVARDVATVFFVHWSAVIEEKTVGEAPRFAVDSWFVDNGLPAVVLPLGEWKKGAGPDV
ncbi:hypothetical protein [Ferribacterium limneticum]|uniref:hypothetical protein n=1 Tax=Ferribacterium limneticum TaxID=76259 RepID=UPI001CFBA32D|nr:hypothetical protein [Ferribacterium limneticum]UCV20226.1 hypothetical protein KI610_06555 [Ferribacterium limneticum]